MNTNMMYKNASESLGAALEKAGWWNIVQDEVKEQVKILLLNFGVLGPPFRQAFVSAFKYTNMTRVLSGQNGDINQPSVLFGAAMSDECYQCAKMPTKLLLQLNDWVEPNEADVQVCLTICNQVERLEKVSASSVNVFSEMLSPDLEDKG